MDNKLVTSNRTGKMSFRQVIRGLAEGSLVALAFALAILVIGTPIALIVRVLYEGLSWLGRFAGNMGAVAEDLISVGSVVGGLVLTAVLARLLVGFFHSRRIFRDRLASSPKTQTRRPLIATAAPVARTLIAR